MSDKTSDEEMEPTALRILALDSEEWETLRHGGTVEKIEPFPYETGMVLAIINRSEVMNLAETGTPAPSIEAGVRVIGVYALDRNNPEHVKKLAKDWKIPHDEAQQAIDDYASVGTPVRCAAVIAAYGFTPSTGRNSPGFSGMVLN